MTKEFLIFSKPYIHEGALLSSSISGRRLYIHHLSEVPLSEVFTTREGNHLQRVDKVGGCARRPMHARAAHHTGLLGPALTRGDAARRLRR